MMQLVGIIVLGLIAYYILKKLLTEGSWLFWLVAGLIIMILLAHMS